MQVSRNRWSFTNYWPFADYDVQPHWLMGWWATGKLANAQYRGYLLKCKKSFRALLQNYEAVVQAEQAEGLEEYRVKVVKMLASARLPFRSSNDEFLGL